MNPRTRDDVAWGAVPSERGFGPRFVAPVLIGPVLNPINTTMISVALVPISRDLGIPTSRAIWLVAGPYLASAVAQPVIGRFADLLGPRRSRRVATIPRCSKTYGSLTSSRARSESPGSRASAKLAGAAPTAARRPTLIWCSRTARDQPSSAARAAYQSRSSRLLRRSSGMVTCRQGSRPPTWWTNSSSCGQAAAARRM